MWSEVYCVIHLNTVCLRGQLGEERVNFTLQLVHIQGRQGRNLEAGADLEAMEGAASLAYLACFLIHSGPPCGLGPFLLTVNSENALQIFLYSSFGEAFSQLRFPPPRYVSVCVKVTKTSQHTVLPFILKGTDAHPPYPASPVHVI